jgi:hypothetical protein
MKYTPDYVVWHDLYLEFGWLPKHIEHVHKFKKAVMCIIPNDPMYRWVP